MIEKLTTDSYLECLIKTMVFTATIFIELVCGFHDRYKTILYYDIIAGN